VAAKTRAPSPPSAVLRPPVWQADAAYVLSHERPLREDFLTRNYRLVLAYAVLHGRSLLTTVIYCSLAVLTALLVNPLCAYALSRFRLPYGMSVLLFLLATMAFPAEVSTIPNFLLLKQLGLLNTFFALILPGAANGYWIFLLKGFFDSLPQELYESGLIDGASEMRMFWAITLPLSRPIFAVIALGAFTAAFGNFLFALITCQDPRMWTLMVWVYELQSSGAPNYVLLAALTMVSIPTLLVFIVSQRVIMRGIIVPTEK
jgi:multiple sugar transport system permease protein